MVKAGLIFGIVMLVLGIGGSLITPICVPCIALMAGVGAGYLASVYEKRATSGDAAKAGAGAGAIAGAGALLGQLIGSIINTMLVGPEVAAEFIESLGMPTTSDPIFYYLGAIGGGVCFGVVDVILMAGLGALCGVLWYQITGKNANSPL